MADEPCIGVAAAAPASSNESPSSVVSIYVALLICKREGSVREKPQALFFDRAPTFMEVINEWKATVVERWDIAFHYPKVLARDKNTPLEDDLFWDINYGGGSGEDPLVIRTMERIGVDENLEWDRRDLAQRFLRSLEAFDRSESIGGGVSEDASKMQVVRNVIDLATSEPRRAIVIRPATKQFWQACISRAAVYRVCAVGTPGIGKATTTPWLLSELLKKKDVTVVYHVRCKEDQGYLYEFIPSGLQGKRKLSCFVYGDRDVPRTSLLSLEDPSTYYVADPVNSRKCCDLEVSQPAKVIIVASPNEEHWGSTSEFTKGRRSMGTFLFYPMWSLPELREARPVLNEAFSFLLPDFRHLSDDELIDRFSKVGGVPSHLFRDEESFTSALSAQDDAIRDLTHEQLTDLLIHPRVVAWISTFHEKSAIIGLHSNEIEVHSSGVPSNLAAVSRTAAFERATISAISSEAHRKMLAKFNAQTTASSAGSGSQYESESQSSTSVLKRKNRFDST